MLLNIKKSVTVIVICLARKNKLVIKIKNVNDADVLKSQNRVLPGVYLKKVDLKTKTFRL